MFLEARGVADRSELDCDVCVVGAGAAGIAIALALADSRQRVLVLESGGFSAEGRTQALYSGEVIGQPYVPLDQIRIRAFGGTTGHWQGWCRPLDEIDFEERPWVPDSGWPIRRAELDRFYARAQRLCELGPYKYDPAYWQRLSGGGSVPRVGQPLLEPAVFQFSPPTRFGSAYRSRLEQPRSTRVLLHANAVRLERGVDGQTVDRAQVAVLGGPRFSVRARSFVLATGGLEVPRLLLVSKLGNDHDLVGRFFADHPQGPAAVVSLPGPLESFFARREDVAGTAIRITLALPAGVQRRERLLGFGAVLGPLEEDPFVDHQAEDERRMEELGRSLGSVALALDRGADRRLFSLFMQAEQSPNRDSRVTLSDEVDELGLPRLRLDWRFSDLDRRSVRRALEVMATALGAAGVGRIYSRPVTRADFWPTVRGGGHHVGTARMHRDPRRGVVDADCRVHGLDNLYVAGSAVFPTSGSVNPTLTIVALALRLADRLGR